MREKQSDLGCLDQVIADPLTGSCSLQDNIPVPIIKQIRAKYANNPDFDPEKIKVASTACEGLSRWVLAMEKYDK